MTRTRNILMALFCAILAVAGVLYAAGEFFQVDMGLFASPSKETLFIVSTTMILLTMCLLPLSLRLFKFRRISADLKERQAPALLRWGCVRLLAMGALLLVNTFLYYAFELESTFGYLAVVVLLCMPFVVPTTGRCQAEVATEEPAAAEFSEDSEPSENSENSEPSENSESSENPELPAEKEANDEETNHSHSKL